VFGGEDPGRESGVDHVVGEQDGGGDLVADVLVGPVGVADVVVIQLVVVLDEVMAPLVEDGEPLAGGGDVVGDEDAGRGARAVGAVDRAPRSRRRRWPGRDRDVEEDPERGGRVGGKDLEVGLVDLGE
jgi:hypothetical protein